MRFEFGEPKTEPLTLDRVKDHVGVDHHDHDALLGSYISAARDLVEQQIALSLVEKEVVIWLNGWPMRSNNLWWDGVRDGAISQLYGAQPHFSFPVGPIMSVTQVSTFDSLGNETVWPSDQWQIVPGLEARLFPARGESWPEVGRKSDGVKIVAKAGFGPDWNSVPHALQHALCVIIADWYEHREGEQKRALPFAAKTTLQRYKKMRL